MKREPRTLAEAMEQAMPRVIEPLFPTSMSAQEYDAFKLAERQHAPGICQRMNPTTFHVEYYDPKTGEIIK